MELDDIFNLLETATLLEKSNQRIEAATKYYESCYLMRQFLSRIPEKERSSSATSRLLEEKIEFYTNAAQNLYFDDSSVSAASIITTPAAAVIFAASTQSPHGLAADDVSVLTPPSMMIIPTTSHLPSLVVPDPPPSPRFTQSAEINRKASLANASLGQAIDHEENNRTQDAIKAYMSAAEMYLYAIRLAEEESSSSSSSSSSILPVLKRRVGASLDRIEALKNPSKTGEDTHNNYVSSAKKKDSSSCSSSPLSKEEISVLKNSSLIAAGLFLPFSEEEARLLSQQVAAQKKQNRGMLRSTTMPWKDPDGDLPLSDKQKKRFMKFARPSEIAQQRSLLGTKQQPPVMISSISPYTIRQQYVTGMYYII
jgi:hypothetical protein